jgi:hypothetical protein
VRIIGSLAVWQSTQDSGSAPYSLSSPVRPPNPALALRFVGRRPQQHEAPLRHSHIDYGSLHGLRPSVNMHISYLTIDKAESDTRSSGPILSSDHSSTSSSSCHLGLSCEKL